MKKATYLITAVAVLALIATASLAGMSTGVDQEFRGKVDIRGPFQIDGTEVTSTAAELNILDGVTASATELNLIYGVTATTAEINTAADLSSRVTTASVTNGQAITLSASTPVITITGTGGANNSTNTITLATPYPLYQTFTLIVDSASTNLITLADSTTVVALGSAWVGDNTDTLVIYTTATNAAVKVSSSDN